MKDKRILQEKQTSYFQHLPAVWTLLIGLALTAGAAGKSAEWEKKQMAADFEKTADGVMDVLKAEVQSGLDVLLSVRSFYLASQEVDKGEFKKFTSPLLAEHREIYAIEWVPRLDGANREAFEARARSEVNADYKIHEQTPDGKHFTASAREIHYPVLFIEPLQGENLRVPGLDYASRPGRMKTMTEALETGKPTLTDMLRLSRFKNSESPYGVLIFLPVFSDSAEGQQGELKGFFSAVFHVHEMIGKALQKTAAEGVGMRLYSSTLEADRELIYERASSRGTFLAERPRTEVKATLDFGGKPWEFVFRPEDAFLSDRGRNDAYFIAVLGALLSFFASFYLYYFESVKHRQILRQLSLLDEMTSLYNRRGLTFLAEEQFRLSRRNKTSLALFIADLNYLKMINDRFGHQEGDRAIKAAAHLIRKSFRDSDIVSRIGGDEFAVVAINPDPAKLKWIAEKIQSAFAVYNKDRIHPYVLNVSLGFSYAGPGEEKSLEGLMEEADKALYEHKIFKPPFEVNE